MLIFPGILSMCFSMPLLTTPSAPMTTCTVIVFNPHIFVISISRSLYLDNSSATFTDVFRSEGIAISISKHVFSCLSLIMMSGLLALIVLSVCTCISQRMVTFSFSVTVSGWWSYHLLFALMLKCFKIFQCM